MVNTRNTASLSNGTAPPPASSPSQVLREQALQPQPPPQSLIQPPESFVEIPRNASTGIDPGLTPIDVVRKRCKDMKKFSSALEDDPVEIALWILTTQQDFQQSELIPFDFVRIGHSFGIPRWPMFAKLCPQGNELAKQLTWPALVCLLMNHMCTPSYAQRLLDCYTRLQQKVEDSTDVFVAKVEMVHLAYSFCSPGNVPPLTHFELLNKVNACTRSWILEYMQRCQDQESLPDFEGARKYLARNYTSISNGVYAAGHAPPVKPVAHETVNPCQPVVAAAEERRPDRRFGQRKGGTKGNYCGNYQNRQHNSKFQSGSGNYRHKRFGRNRGRNRGRYNGNDNGHRNNGNQYHSEYDNSNKRGRETRRNHRYGDQQDSDRNQNWPNNQDNNRGTQAHVNHVSEQHRDWNPSPDENHQGNSMPQSQSQMKHFQ